MPNEELTIQKIASTPMALLQLAIEKETAIDVIERLAKLQQDFTDRQDKISFRNAMTLFKANMPKVIRERVIRDKEGNQKYKVVALEDVATPVLKALHEVGVTYRYKSGVLPDGRISVTCFLALEGTAYEEEGSTLAAPPDTAGGKDPLKAVGSTTSYLEKYTLLASIGMHVHGDDPEAVPVQGVSQEEGNAYVEAIQQAQTPAEVMAAWTKAIAAAKKFTPIDYKGMTVFTEVRDERLKQLKREK